MAHDREPDRERGSIGFRADRVRPSREWPERAAAAIGDGQPQPGGRAMVNGLTIAERHHGHLGRDLFALLADLRDGPFGALNENNTRRRRSSEYKVNADAAPGETLRQTFQQDLWHYTIAKMVDACASAGIKAFYGPFGDFWMVRPAKRSSATPSCSAAPAPGRGTPRKSLSPSVCSPPIRPKSLSPAACWRPCPWHGGGDDRRPHAG